MLRGPSVLAAHGMVVQVDAGGVGLLPGAVIVLETVVYVSAEHHAAPGPRPPRGVGLLEGGGGGGRGAGGRGSSAEHLPEGVGWETRGQHVVQDRKSTRLNSSH